MSYLRQELAQSAGLQILNLVPTQLPPTTEYVRQILATWLNNTCAATIRDSLDRDERR